MRTPTMLAALAAVVAALAFAAVPAASVEATIEPRLDAPPAQPLPRPPELPQPPEVPRPPELVPHERLREAPEVFPIEPLRVDASPIGADLTVEPGVATDEREGLVDLVPASTPAVVATVGAVALLGGLRWLALGAVALYSRLSRSELLDNAHRDKVFQLVRERPGLGVTQIMEAAALGWGTTVYHLDRLERAGMVASERAGLHRCYFPVGSVPREARKGIGALNADTTRGLAQALLAKPGATQSELCAATGLSASALSKQVTKLESAGLVRREREWKTVRLWPEPTLTAGLSGRTIPA